MTDMLRPALRYVLTVYAQRYPRYLLRIVNHHEELYALLMLLVENHCWHLNYSRTPYLIRILFDLPQHAIDQFVIFREFAKSFVRVREGRRNYVLGSSYWMD